MLVRASLHVAFVGALALAACTKKNDPISELPPPAPPAPTCTDGHKNGDETDVDCGAACLTLCGPGQSCSNDGDCDSEFCHPDTKVCATPACNDGFQNGGEIGVDCGLLCPDPCPDGTTCTSGTDCVSGFCTPDTHLCLTTGCFDGYQTNDETAVDCGGGCTATCAVGEGCVDGSDCTSAFCRPTDHTCQTPSCVDTFQNRDETAVDCGGVCGATCDDGEACLDGGDCVSAFCQPTSHLCAPDVCADLALSVGETDVDCGGICGPTCIDGAACVDDGDCLHAFCRLTDHTCQTPICGDGFQNHGETDEDCGGPCGANCTSGQTCFDDGDCADAFCRPTDHTCQVPDCSDGFKNEGEVGVDCRGTLCPSTLCADGKTCVSKTDCVNDFCRPTDSTCQTPTCGDSFKNRDESDVDCGGTFCGANCDIGDTCNGPSDCASGACDVTCYEACSRDLGSISDATGISQALLLSEIEPPIPQGDPGFIEFYNSSASPIALGSAPNWLCSPFTYVQLSSLGAGVTVPAGGFATVPWPATFGDTASGGEILLYTDGSFGTDSHIMDFVCWGTNPHSSRKSQAVAAGKWGAAAPCPGAITGQSIQRLADTPGTSAASYDVASNATRENCRP